MSPGIDLASLQESRRRRRAAWRWVIISVALGVVIAVVILVFVVDTTPDLTPAQARAADETAQANLNDVMTFAWNLRIVEGPRAKLDRKTVKEAFGDRLIVVGGPSRGAAYVSVLIVPPDRMRSAAHSPSGRCFAVQYRVRGGTGYVRSTASRVVDPGECDPVRFREDDFSTTRSTPRPTPSATARRTDA